MDKENLNGVPEEETEVHAAENPAEDISQDTPEEPAAQAEEAATEIEEAASETEENADDGMQEEEAPVMCSVCGEKEAEEGSEYCVDCETAMLKRRIPFTGWLMGFVALGLSLFAFVIAVISAIPSGYVILGDSYAKQGNWHMAYEIYTDVPETATTFNSYVNDIFGTEYSFVTVGENVKRRIVEAVEKYYSPIDAYYFAQNYFSGAELSFTEKYKAAYEENYQAFMNMSDIFNSALDGKTEAAEAIEKIEALRGTEGLKDIYIDYYKFALAYELGEPVETYLEYLRGLEASAEASGEDYTWIYCQPLAQALYDIGEYEEAIGYLDKILAVNKSSHDAYELKMKAQIKAGDEKGAGETVAQFSETESYSELKYYSNLLEVQYLRIIGKYDEAQALCAEATALQESVPQTNGMINLIYGMEGALLSTSEFDRQSAMISIIQGDYLSAFNSMMNAYQVESYYSYYMQNSSTLDNPNFYSVLYMSAKLLSTSDMMTEDESEDVEYVLSMFEEGTMPESAEAVLNGEKTLEEVITKGAFDIT